jgi:NAD(P)-dependent dehydrogenase (short-subunit alcohol dehydrogenase family)
MNNTYDKFDLTGKTALITGAAGLLGIEHAAALLKSGARVVLTDVSQVALINAHKSLSKKFGPTNIIIKEMSVTSKAMILSVSGELLNEGVRVDILVNNAAIDPKVNAKNEMLEASRFENFSIDEWELQIAVGLTGAFLSSQVFGSAMAVDGKGGVILNIASDLSVISPDQRLYQKKGVEEKMQPVKPITYSVIKTGLIGLTRYLATYWAHCNVRCNALSPGGVFNGQDEEFVQRLSSLIPLGRMATKDEYHAALQFLCSDAARYMNGQNIVMDGGRSIW